MQDAYQYRARIIAIYPHHAADFCAFFVQCRSKNTTVVHRLALLHCNDRHFRAKSVNDLSGRETLYHNDPIYMIQSGKKHA
jgi:hypothetical protein